MNPGFIRKLSGRFSSLTKTPLAMQRREVCEYCLEFPSAQPEYTEENAHCWPFLGCCGKPSLWYPLDDAQVEEAIREQLERCYVCRKTWKVLRQVNHVETACIKCHHLFGIWENYWLLYVKKIARPKWVDPGVEHCQLCNIRANVKDVPHIVHICRMCSHLHNYRHIPTASTSAPSTSV